MSILISLLISLTCLHDCKNDLKIPKLYQITIPLYYSSSQLFMFQVPRLGEARQQVRRDDDGLLRGLHRDVQAGLRAGADGGRR